MHQYTHLRTTIIFLALTISRASYPMLTPQLLHALKEHKALCEQEYSEIEYHCHANVYQNMVLTVRLTAGAALTRVTLHEFVQAYRRAITTWDTAVALWAQHHQLIQAPRALIPFCVQDYSQQTWKHLCSTYDKKKTLSGTHLFNDANTAYQDIWALHTIEHIESANLTALDNFNNIIVNRLNQTRAKQYDMGKILCAHGFIL